LSSPSSSSSPSSYRATPKRNTQTAHRGGDDDATHASTGCGPVTGDTSVASYTLDIAARRSRDPATRPTSRRSRSRWSRSRWWWWWWWCRRRARRRRRDNLACCTRAGARRARTRTRTRTRTRRARERWCLLDPVTVEDVEDAR
jgi:hypothetical protein